LETLANTDGNRTESARLLGVSIRTLRNRISEYAADGIDVPRHATPSNGSPAIAESRQRSSRGLAPIA
jgi:regulatory Fis family protein